MKISNVRPIKSTTVHVEIPENTGYFTQKFENTLNLDHDKRHYITGVQVTYSLSGFYNIFARQRLTVVSYFATGTGSNAISINFQRGLYTKEQLLERLNAPFSKPIYRLDGNRFVQIFYPPPTPPLESGSLINFDQARELQTIMGYDTGFTISGDPNRVYTIFVNRSGYILGGREPFRVVYYRESDIPAASEFNSLIYVPIPGNSADFKSILISCNLIRPSTLIGQNYLLMISNNTVLTQRDLNQASSYETTVTNRQIIPIVNTSISGIDWKLSTIGGQIYNFGNKMGITLNIASYEIKDELSYANNIVPYNMFSITTSIPSNTTSGKFEQILPNALSLDYRARHYITSLTVMFDSFSVRNITKSQQIGVITNNPYYASSPGSPLVKQIIIRPGSYTVQDIIDLINGTEGTYPLLQYSVIGSSAQRCVIPNYGRITYNGNITNNVGARFNFTAAPTVQKILGFYDTDRPNRTIYCSSTSLLRETSGATTLSVNRSLPAPALVNPTLVNNTFILTNDLVEESSTIAQNYLLIGEFDTTGTNNFVYERCMVPLITNSINKISWSLLNIDGTPFISQKSVNILTQVSSY